MVKVISLSDEAYMKLASIKRDKSFSKIVIELVDKKRKKKKNLMDFFGIWKDNADEWDEIKNKIYKDRDKFELREIKF